MYKFISVLFILAIIIVCLAIVAKNADSSNTNKIKNNSSGNNGYGGNQTYSKVNQMYDKNNGKYYRQGSATDDVLALTNAAGNVANAALQGAANTVRVTGDIINGTSNFVQNAAHGVGGLMEKHELNKLAIAAIREDKKELLKNYKANQGQITSSIFFDAVLCGARDVTEYILCNYDPDVPPIELFNQFHLYLATRSQYDCREYQYKMDVSKNSALDYYLHKHVRIVLFEDVGVNVKFNIRPCEESFGLNKAKTKFYKIYIAQCSDIDTAKRKNADLEVTLNEYGKEYASNIITQTIPLGNGNHMFTRYDNPKYWDNHEIHFDYKEGHTEDRWERGTRYNEAEAEIEIQQLPSRKRVADRTSTPSIQNVSKGTLGEVKTERAINETAEQMQQVVNEVVRPEQTNEAPIRNRVISKETSSVLQKQVEQQESFKPVQEQSGSKGFPVPKLKEVLDTLCVIGEISSNLSDQKFKGMSAKNKLDIAQSVGKVNGLGAHKAFNSYATKQCVEVDGKQYHIQELIVLWSNLKVVEESRKLNGYIYIQNFQKGLDLINAYYQQQSEEQEAKALAQQQAQMQQPVQQVSTQQVQEVVEEQGSTIMPKLDAIENRVESNEQAQYYERHTPKKRVSTSSVGNQQYNQQFMEIMRDDQGIADDYEEFRQNAARNTIADIQRKTIKNQQNSQDAGNSRAKLETDINTKNRQQAMLQNEIENLAKAMSSPKGVDTYYQGLLEQYSEALSEGATMTINEFILAKLNEKTQMLNATTRDLNNLKAELSKLGN